MQPGAGTALTYKEGHLAIERGNVRLLLKDSDVRTPEKSRGFGRIADPRELRPLPVTASWHELAEEAELTSRWMLQLYRTKRILP